jgi:flagellar hook-associated protein 1 FlgK
MAGTLSLSLKTAQSGLAANQAALDAVANNIANVNTPAYSRKIVNTEQRVLTGVGAGVQIAEITRAIDEGLLKSLRLELGTLNELGVQENFFERVQELFGKPQDNTSLSHIINELTQSLETLAVTPDRTLEQSEVVRQGDEVARKLRDMTTTIQELRLQTDTEITAVVAQMNKLGQSISDLNDQIVRNSATSRDVTDLKDQRDQAIDQLSELVDTRIFFRADGDAVIFTSAGRTLVDNSATTITHDAASSVGSTTTKAGSGINPIYAGEQIAGNDITSQLRSGKLKGLVDLRDSVLTDIQSQLDELAGELRDTFNQIHNRGVAFPGQQSYTGTRNFLDTTASGNVTNQTITLDAAGSVDDVTIALFNSSGDQQAVTTLNTIMTSSFYGTAAQTSHGAWTVTEVAKTVQDWLRANGATTATAAVNSSGNFAIALNDTSLNLAFRDETASGQGSTQEDAVIGFDADGDGTVDETVNGFSNFFGLNDFFVDGLVDNLHETNVVSNFAASAATLRFVDGVNMPLDPGGTGDVTVTIAAGDSLADIATKINAVTAAKVTATVIPDGSGFRLRLAHDSGSNFSIIQSSGTLLTTLGMHVADVRAASQIAVRADIITSPASVSRGAMQFDANLGTAGEYFTSVSDNSIAQALAAQMASSNAFEAAGGLPDKSVTFEQFSSSILARSASVADTNKTRLDFQRQLTNNLQLKSDSKRGVNLDEEMSNLIVLEQAYSASARVITVIQKMFEALERTVQ